MLLRDDGKGDWKGVLGRIGFDLHRSVRRHVDEMGLDTSITKTNQQHQETRRTFDR